MQPGASWLGRRSSSWLAVAYVATSYPANFNRRSIATRNEASSSTTCTIPFISCSFLGCGEWQRETEHSTSFVQVLSPNASLMSLNDRAGNGKTHSHALVLGREKGVEDVVEFFPGNSRTRIRNRDFRRGTAILFGASDHRPAVRYLGHRIYAVNDQIDNDLLQLDRVAPHAQRFRRLSKIQRDIARRCLDRKEIERLTRKRVQIDFLGLKWRPFQEAAHPADHFVGAQIVTTDIFQNFLEFGDVRRRGLQ